MFSRKNPQTDVSSVGINSFNISAGCVWNFPTELSGKYSSLLNVIAWISLVVFREIKEKKKKCHKCLTKQEFKWALAISNYGSV